MDGIQLKAIEHPKGPKFPYAKKPRTDCRFRSELRFKRNTVEIYIRKMGPDLSIC